MRMKELFPHLTKPMFKKSYQRAVLKAKQVNPSAKTISDHDIRNEICRAYKKSQITEKAKKVSEPCLSIQSFTNSSGDITKQKAMEVVSKQISVGTSGSRKTSKVGVEEDVVGTSAAQEDGVEIRGQDKYQDDGDEHRLEETEETGNSEKDVQKVEQNKSKCKFCGKKYEKIGMLIKHIKNVHQEPKVKEQIACPKCKKVLSSH